MLASARSGLFWGEEVWPGDVVTFPPGIEADGIRQRHGWASIGACLTPAYRARPYRKAGRGIDDDFGTLHGEAFLAGCDLWTRTRNVEIDVRFVLQPVF
jgi:hypothetical protein